MDYRISALAGIITVVAFTYALYIHPYVNNLNTSNTKSQLDDLAPLEQFRQTHLKEYYDKNTLAEVASIPFDLIARLSKYIIIGTFVTKGSEYKAVTPYLNYPITHAVVEVEQELTGNLNIDDLKDRRFEFKAGGLSNKFAGVYYGDKILVFIADKNPESVMGDNYFLNYGIMGIYKIVDDKIYGYHYDGAPLQEVIDAIQEARANRIKDITIDTDYAVVGKIKKIEKVSEEENSVVNITVEIARIVPDYEGKEFTFFYDDDMDLLEKKDCIDKDRVCLYFVKYGTRELEMYATLPPEKLNKLAEYYLYQAWFNGYGIYTVKDDGKVYGAEYPEGIGLDELLERIKTFKG